MTLRVVPQGTMDSALAQIGKIADKLYEAEQQPDGIPLVWTPATGTKVATAYVLSGEITDLPFTPESGYWVYAPLLTVRFDCKPFMDGAEITNFVTAVTNANPIQTITLPACPATCPPRHAWSSPTQRPRIARHVEWGLQWRYYDAATSLQINSARWSRRASAARTTRTGSFNTNVVRGSLLHDDDGDRRPRQPRPRRQLPRQGARLSGRLRRPRPATEAAPDLAGGLRPAQLERLGQLARWH
jgi:hypothetical protein